MTSVIGFGIDRMIGQLGRHMFYMAVRYIALIAGEKRRLLNRRINKMNWKRCKWCGLWIKADEEIYCKMCKEYFDAHPEPSPARKMVGLLKEMKEKHK